MTIRTAELTGAALDWAVAKCEGVPVETQNFVWDYVASVTRYSTDWAQGGPIIEREKLCVGYSHQLDTDYVPTLNPETICWARTTAGGHLSVGQTPLIAAMRCYVASKLGDSVDIPEEVLA